MTSRHERRIFVTAALIAVTVTGCSSTANKPTSTSAAPASTSISQTGSTSTPAPGTPTTGSPGSTGTASGVVTVTLPPVTVDTTSPNALRVLGKLNAAMMIPTEAGPGFVKTAYVVPSPTARNRKLFCGQVSTVVRFPNALRAGTTLTRPRIAQFQESVSLSKDVALAQRIHAANVQGLGCSKGLAGGKEVTIGPGKDVSAQVGQEATAWTIKVGTDTGVVIAARWQTVTFGFVFIAAAKVDTSTLPNPLDLAKKAVAKVAAAAG